jgi:RimJ/RimL family protein N-acetyltransferase
MSIDDRELMELHVDALFRHTAAGRLVETREAAPAPAPRFFLGRTGNGHVWRFRDDVSGPLAGRLEALAAAEPVVPELAPEPAHLSQFQALLQEHGGIQPVWLGPAYAFPEELVPPPRVVAITDATISRLNGEFAWLRTELSACEPAIAGILDKEIVSIAFSSRVTARAAEAGVETRERFRGQGHASRAVAAWALAVRESGRIPLYSTSWDNQASQGVARRLGLRLYGVTFSLR